MQKTVLLAALLLSTACESIDSANVRTDGIYAAMSAVADDSGDTRLTAYLKTGGSGSNTFLDLSEGDTLTAYAGAQKEEMDRESLLGEVWYRAELEGNAEGTPLRIEFSREGHDEEETSCRGGSAPSSIATLPAPFAIDSPADDTRVSRKDEELEIAWSPTSSDPIRWELSGSCIHDIGGELMADTGRVAIEKGRIEAVSPAREGETCGVTLKIMRIRDGMIDRAYGEGGFFSAQQHRVLTFSSTP
jgi:hypothetical protein